MAAVTWWSPPWSSQQSGEDYPKQRGQPPPPRAAADLSTTTAELQPISGEWSDGGSSDQPGSVPSVLQRLLWKHALLLNSVQELALLLCVGVLSTVLAFCVDKTIEVMDTARARAAVAVYVHAPHITSRA